MANQDILKRAAQAMGLSLAFFVLRHRELDLAMRRTFPQSPSPDDTYPLMGV